MLQVKTFQVLHCKYGLLYLLVNTKLGLKVSLETDTLTYLFVASAMQKKSFVRLRLNHLLENWT